MITKRHILLLVRGSSLSDGAMRTLLEIVLHLAHNKEMPSYGQLAKARGRARSVMQEHVRELVESGLLVEREDFAGMSHAGNRLRYSFDEEALAKLNGFSTFAEVSFNDYLAEMDAGSMIKAVADGEEPTISLGVVKQALVDRKTMTKDQLLAVFKVRHRAVFKRELIPDPLDGRKMEALRKGHGSLAVARAIDEFFHNRHFYKPKTGWNVVEFFNAYDRILERIGA